jgi:hypothetical protein
MVEHTQETLGCGLLPRRGAIADGSVLDFGFLVAERKHGWKFGATFFRVDDANPERWFRRAEAWIAPGFT